MNKKILYLILVMIGLIGFVYAAKMNDVRSPNPTIWSEIHNDSIVFNCSATSTNGYNITNMQIWSDVYGSWDMIYNYSVPDADRIGNNTINISSLNTSIPEGNFKYGCFAQEFNVTSLASGGINLTNTTWTNGTNYTFTVDYFERPVLTSPADAVYFIREVNGTTNLNLACNVTPDVRYNITKIDFWHNITGTFTKNETGLNSSMTTNQSQGNVSKTINLTNAGDNFRFTWGCRAEELRENNADLNISNKIFSRFSLNKTVIVQYAPIIELKDPTPANNSKVYSMGQTINVTVFTNYSTDTSLYCRVYTNESGTFGPVGSTFTVANNSNTSLIHNFQEGMSLWNIRCYEPSDNNVFGFMTHNQTIIVDLGTPTVYLNNTNNSWTNLTSLINISFTATDPNIQRCDLYINHTNSSSHETLVKNLTAPTTLNTLTTGTTFYWGLNISYGNWTYKVSCNDTAGNRANSSLNQLYVDNVYPIIGAETILNSSRAGYCDNWNISIKTIEPVNLTFRYLIGNRTSNTSSVNTANTINYSNYQTNHFVNLSNQNSFYSGLFNFTACDQAGNCNESLDYDYKFPLRLCTGWTLTGIFEQSRNFSDILQNSSADYVYLWNYSNQQWIYYTSGQATKGEQIVKYGEVIHLYESANGTWDQPRNYTWKNASAGVAWNYNITTGENFILLPYQYTLGSFMNTLFNSSDSWGEPGRALTNRTILAGNATTTGAVNFSYMAVYNNSKGDWVSYAYLGPAFNFTIHNDTRIGNESDLEVIWLYSNFNISTPVHNATWNGSKLVNITGGGAGFAQGP